MRLLVVAKKRNECPWLTGGPRHLLASQKFLFRDVEVGFRHNRHPTELAVSGTACDQHDAFARIVTGELDVVGAQPGSDELVTGMTDRRPRIESIALRGHSGRVHRSTVSPLPLESRSCSSGDEMAHHWR